MGADGLQMAVALALLLYLCPSVAQFHRVIEDQLFRGAGLVGTEVGEAFELVAVAGLGVDEAVLGPGLHGLKRVRIEVDGEWPSGSRR